MKRKKQPTNKPEKGGTASVAEQAKPASGLSTWDIAKLENRLAGMFASVREHCSREETECAGEILGYWAYQLQGCRNKEWGK